MQTIESLFNSLLVKFQTRNKKLFFIVLVCLAALKAAADMLVPEYFDLGPITPTVIGWVTFIWAAMTTVVTASSKGEEEVNEQQKVYPGDAIA